MLDSAVKKIEKYDGGIVIREFIKPELAEQFGNIAINLLNTPDNSSFYIPLFRRFENSPTFELPRIRKAWLNLVGGVCSSSRLIDDPSLDTVAVGGLLELSHGVDEQSGSRSNDRALIVYEPRAVLPTHSDEGLSTRLLNLSGTANFKWHDENDEVFERVDVFPGDLLWTDDSTAHSVQATSDVPRVSLALIDEQTKNIHFLREQVTIDL